MTLRVFIEVESAPGTVTGAGPITDIERFQTSNRLSQAGSWSMSLPATESQAALLTDQRAIMAYVMLDGVKTFLGGGAIDRKRTRVDNTGRLTLEVSGVDLLGEWSREAINDLTLDGSGDDNLDDLFALAPSTWSATSLGTSKDFERQFINETALAAMIAVAKQMGHWFVRRTYLGNVRNLTWTMTAPTTVALTCVMNLNALEAEDNANLATIVSIEEVRTSYDILNTAYVFGAGIGENRLDLAAATLWPDDTTAIGSAYTGASGDSYDYDAATNSISNTTSASAYGTRSKALQFSEVRPLENTDAGLVAAANTLVKAAVAHLERRRAPQVTYRFKLADLRTRIYPGDLIHIDARRWIDGVKPVDIDADVYVLSVTDVVDANGMWTADIEASNVLAWPEDTVTQLAQEAQLAKTVTAHPQMTGNVDTVSHREMVVAAGIPRIWIFLSAETSLINDVRLRYAVRSIEMPTAGVLNDPVTALAAAMEHVINSEDDSVSLGHDYSSAGHIQTITLASHTDRTGTTTSAEPDTGHDHSNSMAHGEHYHNVDNHTVAIADHAQHNHTLDWGYTSQALTKTYSASDLEFNINGEQDPDNMPDLLWRSGTLLYGSAWTAWYELNITDLVRSAVTRRPTAGIFYIDIHAKTASYDPTFSCIVTAQTQMRSVIQQIATF